MSIDDLALRRRDVRMWRRHGEVETCNASHCAPTAERWCGTFVAAAPDWVEFAARVEPLDASAARRLLLGEVMRGSRG